MCPLDKAVHQSLHEQFPVKFQDQLSIVKGLITIDLADDLPAIIQYYNDLLRKTSGSAMAEGPRDALVGRNSATTKHAI